MNNLLRIVVRVKGLEPPRHRRQNLNLVRLPIPPHPHISHPQPKRWELDPMSLTKDQTGCECKITQGKKLALF